jgi:hypothetical protein
MEKRMAEIGMILVLAYLALIFPLVFVPIMAGILIAETQN